jgi:hypothetical protein
MNSALTAMSSSRRPRLEPQPLDDRRNTLRGDMATGTTMACSSAPGSSNTAN